MWEELMDKVNTPPFTLKAQTNGLNTPDRPDTSVSPRRLAHTSPRHPTEAATGQWVWGQHWEVLATPLAFLPRPHRSTAHQNTQAHTTLASDGLLERPRCRAPQDLPADVCFRSSHPARVPPAQSTPGISGSCLPLFKPLGQDTPCAKVPEQPRPC